MLHFNRFQKLLDTILIFNYHHNKLTLTAHRVVEASGIFHMIPSLRTATLIDPGIMTLSPLTNSNQNYVTRIENSHF